MLVICRRTVPPLAVQFHPQPVDVRGGRILLGQCFPCWWCNLADSGSVSDAVDPGPEAPPGVSGPTRRVSVRVAKDEVSQVASNRRKRTRRGRARSLAATVTLAGATLFVLLPSSPALAYASAFHPWQLPTAGNYCVNSGVINNGWLNLGQPSVNSWNNVATYSRPTFAYTSCGSQEVGIATTAPGMAACGVTTATVSGTHTVHAEIRLRSEKTRYWNTPPAVKGSCNFRYTVTHEFGHAVGLNHSCSQSAVTYYRGNAGALGS